MTSDTFPKVLLLGHQFDDRTGIGITLANLFANWPTSDLAILAPQIDKEICEAARPCHAYFGKIINPNKQSSLTGLKKSIRDLIKKWYYYLGLNEMHHLSQYQEEDIKKAQSFNPDIIFCCLGSLNSMKDCEEVLRFFPQSKLVLYIVDDWVNSKANNRLFSWFWRRQNDKYFRRLLDKSAGLLSICPYMSEVYKVKYNKTFIPFHNPVDVNNWKSLETSRKYGSDTKAILYVGKINEDTKPCLLDVASIIDCLNCSARPRFKYVLDIYTPNYQSNQFLFQEHQNCHLFPPVSHSAIPCLMKSYDALLLTLGFSRKTQEYVRLSMPTKLSEYLATGIPTILYCPKEIALAKYLEPNDCTINCLEKDPNRLKDSILKLEDESFCRSLKENSMKVAMKHDTHIVRPQFEKVLRSFTTKSTN